MWISTKWTLMRFFPCGGRIALFKKLLLKIPKVGELSHFFPPSLIHSFIHWTMILSQMKVKQMKRCTYEPACFQGANRLVNGYNAMWWVEPDCAWGVKRFHWLRLHGWEICQTILNGDRRVPGTECAEARERMLSFRAINSRERCLGKEGEARSWAFSEVGIWILFCRN